MDDAHFWSIIEAGADTVPAGSEAQLAAIDAALRRLPAGEVQDFRRLICQKLADGYSWDLWGAAYLINGGCSDDCFTYFRLWLIAQGQAVYEAAVQQPDTLAGRTDSRRDDYELEPLGYIALDVYEELTGAEMPPIDFPWPAAPRGVRWDFEDDELVRQRLPRLARIYLS